MLSLRFLLPVTVLVSYAFLPSVADATPSVASSYSDGTYDAPFCSTSQESDLSLTPSQIGNCDATPHTWFMDMTVDDGATLFVGGVQVGVVPFEATLHAQVDNVLDTDIIGVTGIQFGGGAGFTFCGLDSSVATPVRTIEADLTHWLCTQTAPADNSWLYPSFVPGTDWLPPSDQSSDPADWTANPAHGGDPDTAIWYSYVGTNQNIWCRRAVYCRGSSVNGDPQFTGFMGQSYQVHGLSGSVYNILSTPSFQFNALFTYLESGKTRKGTLPFSHPGNYFGSVGMKIRDELTNEINSLTVISGPVDTGLQVILNNQTVPVSEHHFAVGQYIVSLASPFEVTLESQEFSLRIQNSDMFLNQDISVGNRLLATVAEYKKVAKANPEAADALKAKLPHGILGQTWNHAKYPNIWKYIQGLLFDYEVTDGLLGTEFKYNRF